MSKDLDDMYKKLDQSSKQLSILAKNQDGIIKDIIDIKKQVKDISFKVDLMLDILNNFTIMLAEEDELDNEFDTDQTWVPNEEEWKDDEDEL